MDDLSKWIIAAAELVDAGKMPEEEAIDWVFAQRTKQSTQSIYGTINE